MLLNSKSNMSSNDSGLCKYKNLFGELGKGVHSIRILNIAVVDVISTLILAFVIHQFILEKILEIHWISIWWVIIGCFISGIIIHRLFCVRTTIDKLLFSK
jgi:hypothetical protein